jgi:hypothetical protein
MGKQIHNNFKKRFGDRIEVFYADKPLEGEERRLNRKSLIQAVRVVLAAALNREPTQEELLGIVPICPRRKRGAA